MCPITIIMDKFIIINTVILITIDATKRFITQIATTLLILEIDYKIKKFAWGKQKVTSFLKHLIMKVTL